MKLKIPAAVILILTCINLIAEASDFIFQVQYFELKDGIDKLIEINDIEDEDLRESQFNESLDLLVPKLDLAFKLKEQVNQNLIINHHGTDYIGEFFIEKYQKNPDGHRCQFTIKSENGVFASYKYGYFILDNDFEIMTFSKLETEDVREIYIMRMKLISNE